MTAERTAHHDLGLTVDGSRVEIVDSVGKCIVDHLVDCVLVQSASGAARPGRQAHAAEAQHSEAAAEAVPVDAVDLGTLGGVGHGDEGSAGRSLGAAARRTGLQQRAGGGEAHSGI